MFKDTFSIQWINNEECWKFIHNINGEWKRLRRLFEETHSPPITIEIISRSQIRNDETNLESNNITDELNKERNKQQWHENESIEFVNK